MEFRCRLRWNISSRARPQKVSRQKYLKKREQKKLGEITTGCLKLMTWTLLENSVVDWEKRSSIALQHYRFVFADQKEFIKASAMDGDKYENELPVDALESSKVKSDLEKLKPKSPFIPKTQSSGLETLFARNLDSNAKQVDVENFFKNTGEIVYIQFGSTLDGSFRGFAHAEFTTVETAQQ